MEDLVRIKDLRKEFDDFSLEGINISVPLGCVVGFVGSNGAGKTTTIKALLGLIKPDGGIVELFGSPFAMSSSPKVQSAVKNRIGVVFDTCALPDDLSIKEVGSIMNVAYTHWHRDLFEERLDQFGLAQTKKIKDLSRGMGMKLSLACALCHDAELLVLDEATAGLDPLAREEVLEMLRDFMRDETHGVFMSSHITSDLEKIADRVVCIDDGRIIFDEIKDDITDRAGIARCRSAEFDQVIQEEFFAPHTMRFIRHGL